MPEQASTSAFYISRPRISIEDEEIIELGLGTLSLCVEESTDGLYQAEMTFGNWGSVDGETNFLYFGQDLLDFGKNISITLGEGNTELEVFNGRIMALEGRFPEGRPPEILVLAEDVLQSFRMVRRTRNFEDTNVESLISSIAGDYNLDTDIDIDQTQFSVLTQVNQSDLAFLRDCGALIDAEIWVEDDTLKAKSRETRKLNEVTFHYDQRLREFAVMADLANQRTSMELSGWDVDAKDLIKETASALDISNAFSQGASGPQILSEKYGDRIEHIVHQVPFNATEASCMVKSAFKKMTRKFLQGSATLEGDGRVHVGSHINLEGIGEMFSGTYYVTQATHSFDAAFGYQTKVQVERSRLGS